MLMKTVRHWGIFIVPAWCVSWIHLFCVWSREPSLNIAEAKNPSPLNFIENFRKDHSRTTKKIHEVFLYVRKLKIIIQTQLTKACERHFQMSTKTWEFFRLRMCTYMCMRMWFKDKVSWLNNSLCEAEIQQCSQSFGSKFAAHAVSGQWKELNVF